MLSWSVPAEIAEMAETDDKAKTSNYADFTGLLRGKRWCCQTGLNCRPLHYQWSALPLSYGSMPGSGESTQKGRYRRPVLATRTPLAQARGRVRRVQECPKKSAVAPASCFNRVNTPGRSGSLFPQSAPP